MGGNLKKFSEKRKSNFSGTRIAKAGKEKISEHSLHAFLLEGNAFIPFHVQLDTYQRSLDSSAIKLNTFRTKAKKWYAIKAVPPFFGNV